MTKVGSDVSTKRRATPTLPCLVVARHTSKRQKLLPAVLLAAVLLPVAEAWFRHVMNSTLQRQCGVLGIAFSDLYERSVEAMRADLLSSHDEAVA